MNTLFRKTAKGQAEIETRAHRLLPRLRQALILVDGRRTDAQLAQLLGDTTPITRLLDDGFIEVVGSAPDAPPAPAPAAAAPAPARKSLSVDAIRRDAVRLLTDQLGPGAESMSMKLERARSMSELRPLLVAAAQLLGNVRGDAAAQQFTQRFLADDGAG